MLVEKYNIVFHCKVKRKPHKRTIGIAGFKTVQIPGPNGNPIRAKRYNAIMPPPDNTNRNDLFIPPDLQQLQHYLILLDLPPELAYNSPLLISLAIEPEGRSPVTIDTRGDGNYGHRSFSTLLTGVEDYHWHIRLKIYEYIAANARRIFGIRSANLGEQAYSRLVQLSQMAPQPVGQDLYAGNDDLWALAEMLECNIYTYVPNSHPAYPALNPFFKNNIKIQGAPTLFLLYINNNHFEPIVQFM